MTAYTEMLSSLARLRGVLGALVVSERDGIILDSVAQTGVRADAVAALAASLYRRARLASAAAGHGRGEFFRLDAERGRLCAVGRDDLVLVTISEHRASLGVLRLAMLDAVEALA